MASLTILPFVLFYIHVILLQSVNSQFVFKEANDDLSFKTLCSTNCEDLGNRNDTQDFPLYTCSCSPSCAKYGDCCYDSPHRNETTWEKVRSICVTVFSRGQYRVISGCPADTFSDFCHDSLGHLPPVTSRTTNTTYANIFCASCNEDADSVITWNVELRCSSDKQDDIETSVDDTTEIIYQQSHIWRLSKSTRTKSLCMYYAHFDDFSVIDGLELRPCDNERKISECSSSWRDAEVIKLCKSYEDPVYFGSKMFRNSHCAQCNYMDLAFVRCMPFSLEIMLKMGLLDPSLTRFCQNRGSKMCMEYMAMVGKGNPYTFSQLLNINEEVCVSDPEKRRCCPNERYDFRSKQCRKLAGKR